MTPRRALAGLTAGALIFVMSACSNEQSHSDTLPTTTSAAGPTTESSTSTSTSPSTTSTSSAATTSTIPAVKGLGLTAEGLGDVLFGADTDEVINYVRSILGKPTTDAGWTDSLAAGGTCPGVQIRYVVWHDLSLFFTDVSPAATGIKHFAGYTYGPPLVPGKIEPNGLATANGVQVASTVKQLQAAYPAAIVSANDGLTGPSFFIEPGLIGYLTGTTPADRIISFVGGFECGE